MESDPPALRKEHEHDGEHVMCLYPVSDIANSLPLIRVTPDMSEKDGMEAITVLGHCNGSLMGLVRFSGQTSWERHPEGDELLHVISGATNITLLSDEGSIHYLAKAGAAVLIPRGLWHSQRPDPEVTLMFVTPSAGSERSTEEHPRTRAWP